MKKFTPEKISEQFSKLLLLAVNICIGLIAITLVIFLFTECFGFFQNLFLQDKDLKYSQVIEDLLVSFMYIEFILLIIQYFKHNYHFSLQYFIYIGITAIVRIIIVEHSDATETILLVASIFVLTISLYCLRKFTID
ncbi:MAG: phosphate-starvation-inducible protein PsiE [Staphylococcus warneri]|nr:phosphate-starvation-inducible protein PsiE [Staphylococcus warneri]